MKDFFKSLFSSFLALMLFFGGAAAIGLGMLLTMGPTSPIVPKRAILVFDLNTNIPDSTKDLDPGETMQRVMKGRMSEGTPLAILINTLNQAAQDKNIAALYLTGNLRSEGYGSGYGALTELKHAIQHFREVSGKPVLAYNQGWGKREYFLCSSADTIYCNPFGEVELTGSSAEVMFMAGAFKKYGIEFQVTRVGKYKSAVEPFILEKMSDENREQYQKLLGDLWGEWKQSVARDRKKTPEDLQRIADDKGMLSATEAQKEGLVDKLAYYDEVLDALKKLSGKSEKDQDFPQIELTEYAKIPAPSSGKNRIAVVYAEGEIVDGEGTGAQAGGERLSLELRRLRLDPGVKAVVLRVNSPGGSVTASDLIQREVVAIRKVKPIVISMGSVAASGGYWISTHGSRIFAEPGTITGSIGVFGLLPNVKKLASDHGITWDSVQMAKLAMPSPSRPRTPEELARIQTLVDEIYDKFLLKVAEGRNMSKDAVGTIAQGRVWSGREALKLGLVDEMGGLQEAVDHAAKLAKVEKDFHVDSPEPALTPAEKVMKLLGGKDRQKVVHLGLGDQLKGEFERQLQSLNALNDPKGVYARIPFDAEIR